MAWINGWAARSMIAFALLGCGRVADNRTSNANPDPGGSGGGGSLGGPNTFVDTITQRNVDKIDLLVMIQNSRSMADKQAILKEAVPDLVTRLVTPVCVDANGKRSTNQVAGTGNCAGTDVREFTAIRNIHIGVITSSLGGSVACQGADGAGLEREEADDHGHLIATRPRFAAAMQARPGGQEPDPAGFLDFNPDLNEGQQAEPLYTTFQAMTTSAGEFGCGLESQLESVYRFLVDPAPPLRVTNPAGIDSALLAQREAFLRPDSLVVIVLISDKNDHSIREPGTDLLYPTERYVNALSQARICTSRPDLDPNPASCPDLDGDHQPDIVPNPLFQGATPRNPSLVYLAGIVGVPWQDIQATTDKNGVDYPANELHYKTATDLKQLGGWEVILGDPTRSPPLLPTDGLMVESRFPRNGNDVNGKLIPGPLATQAEDNEMNHHDWGNGGKEDLMYSCIFPLPGTPRDCVTAEGQIPAPGCDCGSTNKPGDNNPLCQNPVNGQYGSLQYAAKAYPSLRELAVLRGLGESAIVASICPRNLADPFAQDYGYRPAFDAIAERLKVSLTGRCLPSVIKPVPDPTHDGGTVIPCTMTEARPNPLGTLGCDPKRGRMALDPKNVAPALAELRARGLCDGEGTPPCSSYTLCTLQEAGPACHTDRNQTTPGWCYVDPANDPNDDQSLVAGCPKDEQRLLRFVDPRGATPANDGTLLIACSLAE